MVVLIIAVSPLQKLSFLRARELSVHTARLPIDEYMVKKDNAKNFHSKILAVNQGERWLLSLFNHPCLLLMKSLSVHSIRHLGDFLWHGQLDWSPTDMVPQGERLCHCTWWLIPHQFLSHRLWLNGVIFIQRLIQKLMWTDYKRKRLCVNNPRGANVHSSFVFYDMTHISFYLTFPQWQSFVMGHCREIVRNWKWEIKFLPCLWRGSEWLSNIPFHPNLGNGVWEF